MIRFPDDIEQYLLDGDHDRAILELARRRSNWHDVARECVRIWLSEIPTGQRIDRPTNGILSSFRAWSLVNVRPKFSIRPATRAR
jgi:hypothetical protein